MQIFCLTDDRWTPPHVKFLWLFGGSEVCLPDWETATQMFSSVGLRALRLPLPGRLSTVPNFTSSHWMLFFVQTLFWNSVINCQALLIVTFTFILQSSNSHAQIVLFSSVTDNDLGVRLTTGWILVNGVKINGTYATVTRRGNYVQQFQTWTRNVLLPGCNTTCADCTI